MKIARFILTLALMTATMMTFAQTQLVGSITTDDGLQYNAYHSYSGDFAVIMSGTDYAATGLFLPETVEIDGVTYPVEAINNLAFMGNDNITVVVFSKNLKRIGRQAFMSCGNLQQLLWYGNTGANIESIGESAFRACPLLKSVILPENLEEVPRNCFTYCTALTEVTFSPKLKKTGIEAFSDCSSLLTLVLPESLEEVSQQSFARCRALTAVLLSAPKLKKIDKYAFSGCKALNNVVFSTPQLDSICESAFAGCEALQSINVPEVVKGFGPRVFSGCTALSDVHLPSNLDMITGSMFYRCRALREIDMPDACTTIGASAFESSLLQRATLPGELDSIGNNAFWSTLFAGSGSAVQHLYNLQPVPVSVKGLHDGFSGHISGQLTNHLVLHVPRTALAAYQASDEWNVIPKEIVACDSMYFSGCRYEMKVAQKELTLYKVALNPGITSYSVASAVPVLYPDGTTEQFVVTGLGGEAFKNMGKLESLNLNNVDSIGYGVFSSCYSLRSFKGDNLRKISQRAFEYCSALKAIELPATTEEVSNAAFIGCSNIERVTVRAIAPPATVKGAFNVPVYESAVLYVPEESLELYKAANGWKEFARIEAISDIIKGDLNGDDSIDGSDVSILLEMVLMGDVSEEQQEVADMNDDGSVDGSDVSILLEIVLVGE